MTTIVFRPKRLAGPLQAPDTDTIIRSLDTYVRFMGNHASQCWPGAVDAFFIGRNCHLVHRVEVPLYEDEVEPDEYEPHIDDVVVFYWFPPFARVTPVQYELFDNTKAKQQGFQYRIFVWPQEHDLLDADIDRNNYWEFYSGGKQLLLGPMLLVKYDPKTEKPLHVNELDTDGVLLEVSELLFVNGRIRQYDSEDVES
ncbi:hypothetical protein VNI00_015925 [Paramarasmius palmivorus]|uniref:Uncharacterized protein n=1 Tax=Paramarasmius palmivorus TaxID=297713 RepID=A0AAW0BGZ6_9AGAR